MKISVHQPHYLPWLGYFDKILRSDVFVILDNVQYKKREFQNRNRIKTPGGPVWLTVPVVTKGKYLQLTREVAIDNTIDWKVKHIKAIKMNYSKAAYFDLMYPIIAGYYEEDWNLLIDINVEMTRGFLRILDIDTPVIFESKLNIEGEKSERILNICRSLDADTYLSGNGAKAYLDEELFIRADVKLEYQQYKHPEYEQIHTEFEPYMSVIDLLMNCGEHSREIICGGDQINECSGVGSPS